MPKHEELYSAIIEGRRKEISDLVKNALESGTPPLGLINETLQPAMTEVGDLFSKGEYFLPEFIMSTDAMKIATKYLQPYLIDKDSVRKQEVIVIGTVEGDLHDIGKNLVIALLEGNGYKVIDLGVDNKPEKFVDAVREFNPAVVGFSALLTTTMVNVPIAIAKLEEAGLRKGRLLAVGGASITQRNADEWGVEIYASDAGSAVKIINNKLTAIQK